MLQGKQAELHLSKFGNGTNGKSIKYKGEWMTPEDYELVSINYHHLVAGNSSSFSYFRLVVSKQKSILNLLLQIMAL